MKAFAASAVLLICLIFLGAIAYVTLDKSEEGLHTLSSSILPKQRAFAAVNDAIVAVQMKTFRYVSWASNGVSGTLLKALSFHIDEDLRAINRDLGTLANRSDLSTVQKTRIERSHCEMEKLRKLGARYHRRWQHRSPRWEP